MSLGSPAEPDAEECAERAERNAEEHRERDRPALVLRRQHQEHDDQAEREDQARLAARRPAPGTTGREYADAHALGRECAATSRSTAASIWPELRPGLGGAGDQRGGEAVEPLSSWVGPLRNSVRTRAESGIISLLRPRTYSRPMSSGRWRNCGCASACTR